MSWLKKNELDLKRHVQDLRENIRSNWTTTGQELSRELRQYWPNSRPQSPAPQRPSLHVHNGDSLSSPQPPQLRSPTTPGTSNDFVAGYAVGLIGGVRSWVSESLEISFKACRIGYPLRGTCVLAPITAVAPHVSQLCPVREKFAWLTAWSPCR